MSDLPVYNLKQIQELRESIFRRVLFPRLCTVPTGPVFDSLVTDLHQELPGRIRRDVVYETTRQLLGHELTTELAKEFAARVAGNLHRLRANLPATPWVGQREDEWVPVQVVRVELGKRREQIGHYISVVVLAGGCCPSRLTRFWRREMFGAMSARVGFTPRWGKLPFTAAEQFVSLRFMAKIEAARSAEQPIFTEVGVPASHKDWNLAVLKRRFKIIPCPNGWTHVCHHCAVGLEACAAATHLKTYEMKFCHSCHENVPFDPESPSSYCVKCTERAVLQGSS